MNVILPESCSAEQIAALWPRLLSDVSALGPEDTLALDTERVTRCDGAGEALIVELYRRSARQGFKVACRDPGGFVARTLRLFDVASFAEDPSGMASARKTRTVTQLGQATMHTWEDLCRQLAFLGELTVSGASLLINPGRLRLRDTFLHFERAGIDALPITLLIGFLIGLILAFLSAASLQQFGVEVYVADLIAIGLFRELGPIITAIILAGRTGSAFAAELGTMKVNEEVDALTTFGLPPVTFLALPRVIAATLVMPILSIFSVLSGLLGGLVVLLSMNIPAVTYWNHVMASSTLTNILLGLMKAGIFGLVIGVVGCAHGLQTERTADAVGRSATAAVVGSLILITVFDGLFAVLFYVLGV
jgi:phospholipid/cholesterol/gamma-HCH transport system permease protein